jgi:hypothetical protein
VDDGAAEGVEISVHPSRAGHGRAMRVDFDFHGTVDTPDPSALSMTLPPTTSSLRYQRRAPTNTSSSADRPHRRQRLVVQQSQLPVPEGLTTITRKKRQISFAWGPTETER